MLWLPPGAGSGHHPARLLLPITASREPLGLPSLPAPAGTCCAHRLSCAVHTQHERAGFGARASFCCKPGPDPHQLFVFLLTSLHGELGSETSQAKEEKYSLRSHRRRNLQVEINRLRFGPLAAIAAKVTTARSSQQPKYPLLCLSLSVCRVTSEGTA